jgi:hypothetical protein
MRNRCYLIVIVHTMFRAVIIVWIISTLQQGLRS